MQENTNTSKYGKRNTHRWILAQRGVSSHRWKQIWL